jgi:sporulation protein YlmC with PRC-barrel domain
MAGAGVRVFQPGEVLSAATVNTYLMDQAVNRFADVTARNAAFGAPQNQSNLPVLSEGRICYLDSTNELQYYNGTSWVSLSAEAISGQIQAKGDLIVGTAATTAGRLPLGVNGQYLVANSTTATGLAWADSAITDESIINADISTSAAIDLGKLADATIDEKSASYTLALTDKNKFIKMSITSTANTVTVPTNASVAFPVGSQIHIIQYGSGKTQVIPVSGTVILYATPGAYLRAQYSSATLLKCDTNIWMLMGDLSAS